VKFSLADQHTFSFFLLFSVAVLVHETGVELAQAVKEGVELVIGRQEGGPEVPSALLLTKARTGNNTLRQ